MAIATTSAGRWFRRVVWLGIFANLALAHPEPSPRPIRWWRSAACPR